MRPVDEIPELERDVFERCMAEARQALADAIGRRAEQTDDSRFQRLRRVA